MVFENSILNCDIAFKNGALPLGGLADLFNGLVDL
jgi:hypothetical protein